jgi:hypothetical protein
MPIIVELSGAVTALITAWLEVRVLPGPPINEIKDLARFLATLATVFGDMSDDEWSALQRLKAQRIQLR